ncbi:MAG: DNA-processing protein DprA [Actinomycetota bacterium]
MNARLITTEDAEWPEHLSELGSHRVPESLHVCGRSLPDPSMSIAIVGTRRPTVTGLELARNMAAAFCQSGYAVVSGLAVGIDAAAHRGALDAKGHTVAVLGCGLNVPYPVKNGRLRASIKEAGTMVTEYDFDTPPFSGNFPERNRIIVGLSCAVVVIEGGLRSGAMITAKAALDADRAVYAVPGSPRNPVAIAPNELIRTGQAGLVTSAQHVFDDLAPGLVWTDPYQPSRRAPELPEEELGVLHSLESVPATMDQVCAATGSAPGLVALILSKLEVRGLVRQTSSGSYEITETGSRISAVTVGRNV